MRRVVALVAGLLLALPAWADLSRSQWQIARPIVPPRAFTGGLVYLPLDDAALAVGSLAEYRIAGDGRTETPYRMVVEEGKTEALASSVTITSRGTLVGREAQVTVDLGAAAPLANLLQLELRGNNFRCRAHVEGTGDGHRWWEVTKGALVYRHEGRFQQTNVALPPNDYRWLRITLSKVEGELPTIEGVRAVSQVIIPRQLESVRATLSRREDTKQRQTVLTLDLGRLTRDLADVRFDVQEPTFDRPMTLVASSGGSGYFDVGADRLRRISGAKEAILPLQVAEARRLRIYVSNGDDLPLTIRRIAVWRVRRGLVFSADPAHRYELWYGNRDASPPVYDIERLPMTSAPAKLPKAALGPERKLPTTPPPPPPWSERHRGIFWGALVAVVVLLAALILRALRGVKVIPPDA